MIAVIIDAGLRQRYSTPLLARVGAVQQSDLTHALSEGGFHPPANLVDIGSALRLVVGDDLNLDEFVVSERAVDFSQHGFSKSRLAGSDHGL